RFRVREGPADPERAAVGVDAVVDEVDLAAVGEALVVEGGRLPRVAGPLVGQPQVDPHCLFLARAVPVLFQEAPHAPVSALVDVEVGVHRVEADDTGQGGVVGLDEVAAVDHAAADPAADGGPNAAVFEVEPGAVPGGGGRLDGAARLGQV